VFVECNCEWPDECDGSMEVRKNNDGEPTSKDEMRTKTMKGKSKAKGQGTGKSKTHLELQERMKGDGKKVKSKASLPSPLSTEIKVEDKAENVSILQYGADKGSLVQGTIIHTNDKSLLEHTFSKGADDVHENMGEDRRKLNGALGRGRGDRSRYKESDSEEENDEDDEERKPDNRNSNTSNEALDEDYRGSSTERRSSSWWGSWSSTAPTQGPVPLNTSFSKPNRQPESPESRVSSPVSGASASTHGSPQLSPRVQGADVAPVGFTSTTFSSPLRKQRQSLSSSSVVAITDETQPGPNDVESLEDESRSYVGDARDVFAFIQWFNAEEQINVRLEFREVLAKEFEAIDRVRRRHQEKSAQKRAKNIRQFQDKMNRDKAAAQKAVKDSLSKIRTESESRAKAYAKDVFQFVDGLKSQMKKGEDEVQRCNKYNELRSFAIGVDMNSAPPTRDSINTIRAVVCGGIGSTEKQQLCTTRDFRTSAYDETLRAWSEGLGAFEESDRHSLDNVKEEGTVDHATFANPNY